MDAQTPHTLTRGQPGYPERLDALDDAPETLWVVGGWLPAPRAVAVVGARAASPRSLTLAGEIGARLATAGVDVISGGALGIDAAAHRGALDAGGATVAVLGAGVDVIYPEKNALLFHEIVERRGALMSQFPPGAGVRRPQFPVRNKVIAGLAELTVVVEAASDSGSLHTARAARALGRQVVAVPGSSGTDRMLVGGARPASSADDVLAILEGRQPAPPPLPDDPDAQRLYAALDHVPRDVGDLAYRAGLGISTCAAMVIDLELDGLATRAAGGRYVRLR
jgi:DNA processing protein